MRERGSHDLIEGDEIAAGRSVLKSLGGGSRYEALLVWDEARFAIMVAKVLRPGAVDEAAALEDLRREAEALHALAHPVIVRGFDAILEGPFPHLLLEHLEGPSLRRLLSREPVLHDQQLLPLALHVAAGLHYLAGAGWVHLDIKPDNLIMGVPPRIIDLSIARTVQRAAHTTGTLGTEGYMAPEQCGEPGWQERIGPPADVFGLCATLWRAATGSRPWPRDRARPHPQLDGPPPAPARPLRPELEELLRAGLARDPADRPSARQLALGLEPLVRDLPIKAGWRKGRR